MNKRLNTWFLLLMLFLWAGFAIAQDRPLPDKVTVDILATTPATSMTLENSEIVEYRRLLNEFRGLRKGEERERTVGLYRGLIIREWGPGPGLGPGGYQPNAEITIYGRRMWGSSEPSAAEWWRSHQIASDNTLELYVLGLARDKGLISEKVYQASVKQEKVRSIPPSREVQVQIMIFSGLPNPIMTLEESELREYVRLLAQFRVPDEEEQKKIFIGGLGYSGLRIKDYDINNDEPFRVINLYGTAILSQNEQGLPEFRAAQLAPDNGLELYLVNLAREKGVIDEEVYQVIQNSIRERK